MRWLTVLNCLGVVALLVLLCVVSERWWVSAALTYVPRAPFLLPSLALIPAALLVNWRFAPANVLCAILVAGPIMGLTAPVADSVPPPGEAGALTIVSCNVQNGGSDLRAVLAEFDLLKADIVALQETQWGCELLTQHFSDWNTVHVGEFWVSSRFPVRLIDEFECITFERRTAILCEVDAPQGTILLCDVHLNTARHGLTELRWHSPLTGAGVRDFEFHEYQRGLEAEETLQFISEHAAGRPLMVLGDFNSPATSNVFCEHWSGFRSAFETAGAGYGYTSPCNTTRLWPANTPWLRIDHILVDDAWAVHACDIGRSDGSDHRLIWARVSRR